MQDFDDTTGDRCQSDVLFKSVFQLRSQFRVLLSHSVNSLDDFWNNSAKSKDFVGQPGTSIEEWTSSGAESTRRWMPSAMTREAGGSLIDVEALAGEALDGSKTKPRQ